MGQEVNENHVIVAAPTVDLEAEFPDFDYPAGDKVKIDPSKTTAGLTVRDDEPVQAEDNGVDAQEVGLLQPGGAPVDETPAKMPRARVTEEQLEAKPECIEEDPDETSQAEVSKHVVAIEARFDSALQPSQVSKLKVLESNPSFKTIISSNESEQTQTSPKKFHNSNMDLIGENDKPGSPEADKKVVTTPIRRPESMKVLSGATTPELGKYSHLKADSSVEKYAGGRSRRRDEPGRILSATQIFTSPRNVSNSQRSRSPVPHHWQDQTSGAATERRGSISTFDPMAKSPRYIAPTIAASLKTVKAPAAKNASLSKALSYPTTTFGTTTLDRDPVKRGAHGRTGKEDKSNYPSLKVKTAPTITQPSGFHFRCDERAEKRREFYTKLEERLKVKEAERKQMEARTQEEKESQLRELRRSLTYKANPVPSFYQEPVPPPSEIKKTPPTRAKSPNFTPSRRRDSVSPSASDVSTPVRTRTVRRSTVDTSTAPGRVNLDKIKQIDPSSRLLSSVKKPTPVQKADVQPRKSVARERSGPLREKAVPVEGPVKAFPRAEASEYLDDFVAMQRYVEEEEMNGRRPIRSENGVENDADFATPNSNGSDRGKVWSPEELAKMYIRRNSPAQDQS